MRLRTKITTAALGGVLLAGLLAMGTVASVTNRRFSAYVLDSDRNRAQSISMYLSGLIEDGASWSDLQSLFAATGTSTSHGMMMSMSPLMMFWSPEAGRLLILNAQGSVVVDTESHGEAITLSGAEMSAAEPIVVQGQTVGFVMLGSMIDAAVGDRGRTLITELSVAMLLSLVVAVALTTAFLIWLLGRFLSPIPKLTRASLRAADGDFSTPVPVATNDELGLLAQGFNAMTREIRRETEARNRMFADIAHELKTPLTLIRGTVEAMIDGIYPPNGQSLATVLNETVLLGRLVDDLQLLSRMRFSDPGFQLEEVSGAEFVRQLGEGFAAEAERTGIDLTTAVDFDSAHVRLDPVRARQAVGNAIANALRHTPQGGAVRIEGELDGPPDGRTLHIRVTDTGPGIPVEDLDRIFSRLYRVDGSRSRDRGGTGLGLAIARAIVEAHGGKVWARNGEAKGAEIHFEFPGVATETP